MGREAIQHIAALSDPMFKVASAVRNGELDELLPRRPDVDHWHALYRDHDMITRGIGNAIPDLWGIDGDEMLETMDFVREFSYQARTKPRELATELLGDVSLHKFTQFWRVGIRQCKRNYRQHLIDLRDFLRGSDPHDVGGQFELAIRGEPAVYFFLRVVFPAILMWQTTPQRLLRQARSANDQTECAKAVERLVRLDPLAISLPDIQAWQNVDDGPTRQYREQQVLIWRKQGLNHGEFTIQDFKMAMGGLILTTARHIGRYLDARGVPHDVDITTTDARNLLDAAAQDRAGRTNGVCDEDIEEVLPSTWSRRLRHYRKIWDQLIPGTPGSK